MIGTDAKYRRAAGAAKFGEVFGLAVEHDPGDTGGSSSAARMGQSRTANRFEDDRVGMFRGARLNDVQELLALVDGVVRGIDDFDVNAEALSCGLRSACLLDLKIIIVSDQRYQEPEPFHGWHAPGNDGNKSKHTRNIAW